MVGLGDFDRFGVVRGSGLLYKGMLVVYSRWRMRQRKSKRRGEKD
jgi:hypothetical protein